MYLLCFCSDKPGNHNFDLLKKLVLPDGSVLRAQLPGRPTRDCLFVDPARDGTRYVHSICAVLKAMFLKHNLITHSNKLNVSACSKYGT